MIKIIGDVILDVWIKGNSNRYSPEAPVKILDQESNTRNLGGAANVARNIKSLGATAILCSVVGDDFSGKHLKQLLQKEGLQTDSILMEAKRKTTVKTRVISEDKHQLRIDEEQRNAIKVEKEFLELDIKGNSSRY